MGVATMKLVLDAAPITSYGIILNQLPPDTCKEIMENPRNLDPKPVEMILQCLLAGLRVDQRSSNVHLMARQDALEGRANAVTLCLWTSLPSCTPCLVWK